MILTDTDPLIALIDEAEPDTRNVFPPFLCSPSYISSPLTSGIPLSISPQNIANHHAYLEDVSGRT